MIKLKIGLGLAGFFTIPIETAIETIANTGYDGFEVYVWKNYIFDSSVLDPDLLSDKALKSMLDRIAVSAEKFNLEISSLLALDINFGYRAPTEVNRVQHIEFTKQSIDIAEELGTKIVNVTSGLPMEDHTRKQSWEKLIDSVGSYVDYASGKGITIAMEPHAPFRGQDMMVDSLEALLELLATINSKSLAVNFDPSHFSIRGWDVPAAIRKLSNHIVHTHFKGSRGLIPEYKWYIPGEYPDDVDAIKEFALALREINYDGFISVEIANSRRTDILFNPKSATQLAYKTFSSVLDKL